MVIKNQLVDHFQLRGFPSYTYIFLIHQFLKPVTFVTERLRNVTITNKTCQGVILVFLYLRRKKSNRKMEAALVVIDTFFFEPNLSC